MKTHYITPTFRLTAPDTCCVFCKNCLHYLWDYSNGIYSVICEIGEDEQKGFDGKCDKFDYDGGIGERVPTEEEVNAHTEYLKQLVEFCERLPEQTAHKIVLDKNKGRHFQIDEDESEEDSTD